MDNPLTLEEKDLLRLADYIDCEGTIALQHWNRGKKGVNSYQPKVSIFNTSPVFAQHVIDIYNKLGVKVFIETQKRKAEHKVVYRLVVLGISRVHKVLELIKPYLLIKRAQADCVKEFCELRMEAATRGRGRQVPYGQREFELHEAVKLLNLRGVSETECCEPQVLVQTLVA